MIWTVSQSMDVFFYVSCEEGRPWLLINPARTLYIFYTNTSSESTHTQLLEGKQNYFMSYWVREGTEIWFGCIIVCSVFPLRSFAVWITKLSIFWTHFVEFWILAKLNTMTSHALWSLNFFHVYLNMFVNQKQSKIHQPVKIFKNKLDKLNKSEKAFPHIPSKNQPCEII